MTYFHKFCFILLAALTPTHLWTQAGALDQPISHGHLTGDLANVLAQVSYSTKIPIIGELALPLPTIDIREGSHSGRYLIQAIADQAAGYKWQSQGLAVLFYKQTLEQQKLNPLSLRFPRFVMPENVSKLKYILPSLEGGLLEGPSPKGVLLTGFGDVALEKYSLQAATLENVSGREILVQAARQSPFFSVIVIFDESKLKNKKESANAEWHWQSFSSALMPIYPPNPKEGPSPTTQEHD
jgi:hypothetical protein